MSSALDDEVVSINAIYGESTLRKLTENPVVCVLELPGTSGISLRLEFLNSYPDAPPTVLGTESVGETVARGEGHHVVDICRLVMSSVYQPGEPCLYGFMEEIGEKLQSLQQGASEAQSTRQAGQGDGQATDDHHAESVPDLEQSNDMLDQEPSWVLSDVVTEKKSVFVARAARVSSPLEAKTYLQHLLSTDKKAAKATHNITAWRIQGANDTVYQDCDDDGETAAGSRLLHLMQLMDIWNVMVIVTRWYGGVQLGPDRFRIINSVARDAFTKGGFIAAPSGSQKGQPHRKKEKK